MQYLELAVRRILEVSALLLGALLVLVSVLLGVFVITTPGCTVDIDHTDGVWVARILAGAWIVLELLLAAVLGTLFVRTDDATWLRVVIAVALPVGAAVLWVGFGGVLDAALDGLGAGPGSSSCW